MSANRKLQTEIDRTLKKVEEGVDIFDEIWDKVYSATQQNQKEKYEVDLKKEIKKLQRHRDQIKTWVASSDIKDKRPLTDARKLIETKMEQFKVCEKETKTKTYSKEGLARETKIDPHEAAKNATRDWLSEKVDALMLQIDMHEADTEKLTSGKGGAKRNKNEIEGLEASIKRHRWHIAKLEQITRLLDNDALAHEQINEIKEDVEYYIDANQEPDFMDAYDETMDIFESLDLGDLPTEDELALAKGSADRDEDKEAKAGKKKQGKKGTSANVDDDDDDDRKNADDKKSKKSKKDKQKGNDTKGDADERAKDKKRDKKNAVSALPLTIGRATVASKPPSVASAASATAGKTGSGLAKGGAVPSTTGVPQPVLPPPPSIAAGESMANILLKTPLGGGAPSNAVGVALGQPGLGAGGPQPPGGMAAKVGPGDPTPTPMAARLREIQSAQFQQQPLQHPAQHQHHQAAASGLQPHHSVTVSQTAAQRLVQAQQQQQHALHPHQHAGSVAPPGGHAGLGAPGAPGGAAGGVHQQQSPLSLAGAQSYVLPAQFHLDHAQQQLPPPQRGTRPTFGPPQHGQASPGRGPGVCPVLAQQSPARTHAQPQHGITGPSVPSILGAAKPPTAKQPSPAGSTTLGVGQHRGAAAQRLPTNAITTRQPPLNANAVAPPSSVNPPPVLGPRASVATLRPVASLETLVDVQDQASADDTYARLREAEELRTDWGRSRALGVLLAPLASTTGAQSAVAVERRCAAEKRALADLAASTHTAPSRADADRPRQYVPRNPYATPTAFPAVPAAAFEDPSIYDKLGTDTLFFIFYFCQGTYQQYLAARELKKQSWRYHKKYMTWFQRHEEPKVTTDEYEQGSYVYFDYETGWCQRIKSDFTFEYNFLEDELLV